MNEIVSEQKRKLAEAVGCVEAMEGIKCPECGKVRPELFEVDGKMMCIVCYGDRREFP